MGDTELPESRRMTAGEIAEGRTIYADHIQWDLVRFQFKVKNPEQRHRPYVNLGKNIVNFPNGLQPFEKFHEDLSNGLQNETAGMNHRTFALIIHELGHIWQSQHPEIKNAGFGDFNYKDKLNKQPFSKLTVEEQAEVMSDIYLMEHGETPNSGLLPKQIDLLYKWSPIHQSKAMSSDRTNS